MSGAPSSAEIITAAVALLREELIPSLPPEQAFKARVLANALALVGRDLTRDRAVDDATHTRLAALVHKDGNADELAGVLAVRIEDGALSLTDPALIDHLWRTALARIAVDQPGYASFVAETSGDRR